MSVATHAPLRPRHVDNPLLRDSPPSSSSLLGGSPPSLASTPKPSSAIISAEHHESIPRSPSTSSRDSSPPSSADMFSSTSSFTSSPVSSGLSFGDKTDCIDDDDFQFPDYGSPSLPPASDDESTPMQTPADEDCGDVPEISTTTDSTRSDSPLPTPTVADDTAVKYEPEQHVDYLNHDWREEDIWSSWRHIVSQRSVYGQRSRLENASWRTWAKAKQQLGTIPAEKLNWLKESDCTWLYGPLQQAQTRPITNTGTSEPTSQLSKSTSFIDKKPILKKRSMSEILLQKSISSSCLVKQAAASVQAQQTSPPRRVNSAFTFGSSTVSIPSSRDPVDYFSSKESSFTNGTPLGGSHKDRHIRFDEKVEQCIAVECKEDVNDDEGYFDDEPERDPPNSSPSDSSGESSESDAGLVMMKPKRPPNLQRKSSGLHRNSNSISNSRMIETIPSTTLKYHTDSPDLPEQSQHHTFGAKDWTFNSTAKPRLSPSASQETLRPSTPSRNFLLPSATTPANPSAASPSSTTSNFTFGSRPSTPSSSSSHLAPPLSPSSRTSSWTDMASAGDAEVVGLEGMRRTESGMFMPYGEDEDDIVAEGLFGRVSDTFNTMKDIGHVIWNVGWS